VTLLQTPCALQNRWDDANVYFLSLGVGPDVGTKVLTFCRFQEYSDFALHCISVTEWDIGEIPNASLIFLPQNVFEKTFCRYCDDLNVAVTLSVCPSVTLLLCLTVTSGAIWITGRWIFRFTSEFHQTYRWMSTTRKYNNELYVTWPWHINLTPNMTPRGKTQKMVIYCRLLPLS
jgi:hypothetical protein